MKRVGCCTLIPVAFMQTGGAYACTVRTASGQTPFSEYFKLLIPYFAMMKPAMAVEYQIVAGMPISPCTPTPLNRYFLQLPFLLPFPYDQG